MSEPVAASQVLSVPTNFPVASPMDCKGDQAENWKFFRLQWEGFETATELNKKSAAIRIATLRSVMGKEYLRIYHHLDVSGMPLRHVFSFGLNRTMFGLFRTIVSRWHKAFFVSNTGPKWAR